MYELEEVIMDTKYNKFITSDRTVGDVDGLLSQVLTTRLQSKSKAIIISNLEFLATDLALYLTISSYDIESDIIRYHFFAVLGVAALYAIVLGVFLFYHALVHTKQDTKTSQEVANAFTTTNHIPVFDGCLELPFPIMFKGSLWYVPYITWTIFGLIIAGGAFIFYTEWDMFSNTTMAEVTAGILLLYQITSDFSEYWVLSRNQVEIEVLSREK